MPRIMTMNGDHRSVATAPLDLRTTSRDRGTTNCKSRVRDAPQGSETGASRKRPTDKASFRLPFRKRPIPIEPETPTQTPTQTPVAPSCEDRISPAADFTVRQSVAGHVAEETEDILPASATPRRNIEAGRSPEGYHTRCFYAFEHVRYPVFCPPPVPDLCHPLPHQTENLQHGIALATRQDEDGDTALHIAVVQGELAIVYKLIQLLLLAHRSLDIYNNLRQTPLHLAVITDQATLVEVLLREGADPSALDRNGQTAMHLCCEYNKKECLSVVLSTSSFTTCLEMRNYQGLSPLHLAVLRGHKDLATMLLKAGADINAMDIKSGQSPLMHAVESNNADMVHFLIEHGCDVNSQSYSGNTALHSACGRGQADTVRLLLKSGADSSLKNYHNDTPVMVAKNKKIEDVLRGRVSTQLRVQDQLMSVSNHEGNFTNIGSPSLSHSRGCSPLTAPHTLHHSTSHSPKTSSTTIFPYFQRNDLL